MRKALFIAILSLFPSIAFAASPAIDHTNSNIANPTTSLSFTLAHTNSSGECDVVYTEGSSGGSDVITGITDNGVAMTPEIASVKIASRWQRIWFLAPAPSGTQTIVVSSGNDLVSGWGFSYTGCDAFDTAHQNTGTGTSWSDSITTSGANETVLAKADNGSTPTQTWGGTLQQTDAILDNAIWNDKAIAGAGPVSITYTGTSAAWGILDAALCPTGGCAATPATILTGIINAFAIWW